MQCELSGIYGCLDLPLTFTHQHGCWEGPQQYRVREPVRDLKGQIVGYAVKVKDTQDIVKMLEARYGDVHHGPA